MNSKSAIRSTARAALATAAVTAVALFTLSAFSGCGGEDGPAAPVTGSLAVSSTPPDASIFLNGAATGALTDGTIAVAPGTYALTLKRPGYADSTAAQPVEVRANETTQAASITLRADLSKRVVLVDHLSNTSCEPCFDAENNLEAALRRLGVAVSYSSHLGWPSAADPFYLDNVAQSVERGVGITYMPLFWIDGAFFDMPSDFNSLVSRIEAAAAAEPSYEITVRKTLVGDSLVIIGGLIRKTRATAGLDLLIVGVIETDIEYDAVNGIDRYDDIVRGYLPVTTGVPFMLDVGGAVEFNNSLPLKPGWVESNIEVIASIRSATTGVVYQTGSTR